MGLRSLLLVLLLTPLAQAAEPAPPAGGEPGPDPGLDPERTQRGYVGAAVCGECHPKELGLWKGSDHDLAMKEAAPETVLGDFADAEIETHGVTWRFYRRDEQFMVRTEGPNGDLQDYPIQYAFGSRPLQQYLVELSGGRLQSLNLAWDARPREQGGQRWLDLYFETSVDHGNPPLWTSRNQTWNDRCADCHSTDLQKRYDAERGVYDTRYAEIDVACEACHGPGAGHVDWARAQGAEKGREGEGETREPTTSEPSDAASRGLLVDLDDRDGGVWQSDPETGLPKRLPPRALQGTAQVQTETCAQCHSNRGRIWPELNPGEPIDRGFRLALLEPDRYFPDGQIKDETYVYGSFIQSRMFHQGVVCSDCHDPHSLKLRSEGNGVCAACHAPEHYDSSDHHHHQTGSAGAACVACHMPPYPAMLVDERADHSMRVPRPDLTLKIGTPNACNGCHEDKGAAWASAAVEAWYPDPAHRGPHFGEALFAADIHAPDAGSRLLALASDLSQPAIARASALAGLHDDPERLAGPDVLPAVRGLLADPNAWVRAQAVRLLDLADLQTRVELARPGLSDPARVVRLEATRILAPLMARDIDDGFREQLSMALEETVASEMVNADRPEAHLNLGLLATAAGEPGVAHEAYRTALRLDHGYTPARIKLADLYRELGRDAESEAELEAGLGVDPESADLHFALGLAQGRNQRSKAAVASLARAVELAPENSRYAYVYARALGSAGRTAEAVPILETAQGGDPANRDILVGLVQLNAELGKGDTAKRWLDQLAAVASDDPVVQQLQTLLEQSAPALPPSGPS